MKVNARELLYLDKKEIWDKFNFTDIVTLVCDDGEIELTGKELVISTYLWYPITLYPKAPIKTSYTLAHYNRTKGELLKLKADVAYGVKSFYEDNGEPIDFENLGFLMKSHDDVLFNELSSFAASSVGTLSALDYRDLYYHPKMVEIRDKINAIDWSKEGAILNSEIYVEEAHSEAKKLLKSEGDPILEGNRLYHLGKSNQLPHMQIIKQMTVIGHACDIDSRIFPKPILTNYSRGLRTTHDVGVDAKSGTRSLAYQADPLEQTEYANRESQILSDIVTDLEQEDCGTKLLLPWIVTESNLAGSQGMLYKFENTDEEELKMIKADSRELIGKIIYLRNPMTCETQNAAGVCKTCYGKLSEQLPKKSSIGRIGIFILSSDVSQKVLSLKHDGGTATSKKILFSEEDSEYVYSLTESQTIYVKGIPDAEDIKIKIPRKYIENLGYVHRVKRVSQLDLSIISDVKDFTLEVTDEDGDIINRNINVALSARTSNLTYAFLNYVRNNSYEITQNDLIISLKNWDFTNPILTVPRKHYSMLDFLAEFKKEVQNSATSKNTLDLSVISNVSMALSNFNDLVSSKFFINLTHLCVTMRASIANDPSIGDFRLMLGENARFAKFKQLVPGRSIATALCHENIVSFIYNINSFNGQYKQFHPYDNIVLGDM